MKGIPFTGYGAQTVQNLCAGSGSGRLRAVGAVVGDYEYIPQMRGIVLLQDAVDRVKIFRHRDRTKHMTFRYSMARLLPITQVMIPLGGWGYKEHTTDFLSWERGNIKVSLTGRRAR